MREEEARVEGERGGCGERRKLSGGQRRFYDNGEGRLSDGEKMDDTTPLWCMDRR